MIGVDFWNEAGGVFSRRSCPVDRFVVGTILSYGKPSGFMYQTARTDQVERHLWIALAGPLAHRGAVGRA